MMISGNPPDCKACGYTIPIPENYQFIDILNRWGFMISDGMGGIKMDVLESIFDLEFVDERSWFERILDYFKGIDPKKEQKEIFLEKIRIYFGNGMRYRDNITKESGINFQKFNGVKK